MLRSELETLAYKKTCVLRVGSSFVVPSWINGVLTETFTQNTICIHQILVLLSFPVSKLP